jgi:hypothetical protein
VKIDHIKEPELEFGFGQRHVDIRFGIMNSGPLDVEDDKAPRQIRLGMVGTSEDVERASSWLERCRSEIAGAESKQPNLRPHFPGFRSDVGFKSTLVLDTALQRTLPSDYFDELWKTGDANAIVTGSVEAYLNQFAYLFEHERVDVVLAAVPQQLEDLRNPQLRPRIPSGAVRLDFHNMLKAKAMTLREARPVQLMVPSTADPSRARKSKGGKVTRRLQDEATRAWNLHTALYYKSKGRPWRVPRDVKQPMTCYVGVSFYYDLERETVLTSMAQVFDERGEGVIVRGGTVKQSKDDRTPHLAAEDAEALLLEALERYRDTHENAPARIVIHKTSSFNAAESDGVRAAAKKERIGRVDAVSVTDEETPKLLRYGAYPPLRGTWLALDDKSHLLYTHGSVDFYATYPGLYIPQPVLFRCDDVQASARQLGTEMLALSKLNWNHTQFDGSQPITLVAARKVGAILKYLGKDDAIAPRYSFYM